jgi:hypothetical protein
MSKAHKHSELNITGATMGANDSIIANYPMTNHPNDIAFGALPTTNTNITISQEGLFVEESTTNLCTNPTTLSGWVVSNYTSRTPYRYIDRGSYTEIKFTSISDLDTSFGIEQTVTGITADTNYTWSVYTSASRTRLDAAIGSVSNSQHYIEMVWLDSTSTTISTLNTTSQIRVSDTIVRWITTGTAPTGATQVIVRCKLDYPNLPLGESFSIYMPQLEAKAFVTSFANGSRWSPTLRYPLTFNNNMSFSFWHTPYMPTSAQVGQSTSPNIFELGNYYDNASLSFWCWGGEIRSYVKGDSGSGWQVVLVNTTFSASDWLKEHYWTLTFSGTNGWNAYKVYHNGILLNSSILNPVITKIAGNFYGMGIYGGTYPNALYRNLSVYNCTLTDDEVKAIYNSELNFNSDEGVCT